MNSIIKEIFVKKKTLPVRIDYVQGTTIIPIVLRIVDWKIPEGAEARIYIQKPSNFEIYNSAVISAADNTVTIKPTKQMFAESGTNVGQVQICSGNDILNTFLIIFMIERRMISDSAIESTDEFTILDSLISSAREEIQKSKSATQKANVAAGMAEQKATLAFSAASAAEIAANAADTAKKGAESAAQTAANAASAANTAKASADTAAQRANDAAAETETAAADAREAAQEAREAASKVTISEEDIARIKEMILLAAYPVGKIYATVDPTNPGELFGGTWERWGQGRVPVGVNEGDADFNEPEKTGGEKEHLLTLAETPVHSHTVNSHQHSIPALTGTAASNGSHNHRTTRKNNNAASGDKAVSGPYAASNIGTSGYATVSTDDNGEHTHTVITKASNTGNESPGTNNAGDGEAHNNMQPYITCYMWKRVA